MDGLDEIWGKGGGQVGMDKRVMIRGKRIFHRCEKVMNMHRPSKVLRRLACLQTKKVDLPRVGCVLYVRTGMSERVRGENETMSMKERKKERKGNAKKKKCTGRKDRGGVTRRQKKYSRAGLDRNGKDGTRSQHTNPTTMVSKGRAQSWLKSA